ncbi:MAG TPA: nuclear transport factor 2 family protein, partial [Candidatus Krumholzibacteriaceae bacterium]|nr:nuclear transport factor 2 family protein [Candidatus Krumholzibacteriaceae bacterium]
MKKFIGISALFAAIIILLPMIASAESDMSRLNRERAAIGRALLEMQSDNWQSLLHHYTEEIEYHDPIVTINGIDLMAQFLGRLLTSSPDLVTIIEDETCINGIYSATWTMSGSFNDAPYDAKGITIFKFLPKSTKVYYQRDYYTEGDIMSNIPGLDEVIGIFRTYYRCAVDPTFDCPMSQPVSYDLPGGAIETKGNSTSENKVPPGRRGPRSDRNRLTRERKKIARAIIEINADNWTSLLQYYTYDTEYRDPIVIINGIDTMTEFLGRLFAGGPNLITTVEDETCINGIYTATWTMAGSFDGFPYSAKGMS